ncbi:MAG: GH92 family glycosyl hydrolase [Prevotellaceae bacterium]|nr:GH92 family glycosyl hydrolase [Prevotellaceae bacterium]
MRRLLLSLSLLFSLGLSAENWWTIGEANHSAADLALGPGGYKDFVTSDFGYEDLRYIIGTSTPKADCPYVLAGPDDAWGGTGSTAGWRTHEINILYRIGHTTDNAQGVLLVDVLGVSPNGAVLKVSVNGYEQKFDLPAQSCDVIYGKMDTTKVKARTLQVPFDSRYIRKGGNTVTISIIQGGWVCFDRIAMQGSGAHVDAGHYPLYIRKVEAADYQTIVDGKAVQPLLVDVEHVSGHPTLRVELDGKAVFTHAIDTARYCMEVPMPAVKSKQTSRYAVYADNLLLEEGTVVRMPCRQQTPAHYVETMMGAGHSRWMIAPGPWMPMSMVKLSPDNQNAGWQAGYQPTFETIGCFSHIHEWTMAGLGVMPTTGKLQTQVGDQFRPDEGFRSRIDKQSEKAPLGYYSVKMTDTDIDARVTATEHCSMMHFTYHKPSTQRVMVDLHIPAEYDYRIEDVDVQMVDDHTLVGSCHQLTPRVWSSDADQEYTLHFYMEFNRPIANIGSWADEMRQKGGSLKGEHLKDAGMWVEFGNEASEVMVRTGISMVSTDNARENLYVEMADKFGWEFDAVVNNQLTVWNDILSRVEITTPDRMEKVRFYTNLYRSFCRNRWSDVNGQWVTPDESVRQLSDKDHMALGCDAFWNTFWNLNQVWNLITPEWASRWVNSQLALYDACGWLAKGPAGMEYIPVMVAEHEIPQMVSAYQMGIRDYDAGKMLQAMVKMQTTPAQHVAGGFAGNRDLEYYMKHHFVPADKGRFSNTLEYSFDDWAVSQLAKNLGHDDIAKTFADRGTWWRNAINPENGYAHLRNSDGQWQKDFNPITSGANEQYVEGNAWQLSYFVPQDVPGLVDVLGTDSFIDRLDWGFRMSEIVRYNAPNDMYWDYPVVQGNQQSMHFAFLFNWAGRPDLTQKWTRSIIDRYYGFGTSNAYLGDEDQGQMSAWFVMAALGLFQIEGGCSAEPWYELASPLYEKIVINLGGRYGRGNNFTIKANGTSRHNKYIRKATLNGKPLNDFRFPASELLKGGTLELDITPTPNEEK